MLIDAQALPRMAFVGTKFDNSKFHSVSYHMEKKPGRCLWASPFRDDGRTEWQHYAEECDLVRYRGRGYSVQHVTANTDAKIFEVAAYDDVNYLETTYHWDWDLIAEDYDAVYVTQDGVWEISGGKWDIESIVFFNTSSFTVN